MILSCFTPSSYVVWQIRQVRCERQERQIRWVRWVRQVWQERHSKKRVNSFLSVKTVLDLILALNSKNKQPSSIYRRALSYGCCIMFIAAYRLILMNFKLIAINFK